MARDEPLIRQVIVWSNGMVMVFDTQNEQVPALQGTVGDVWETIKERVKRELDDPRFRGIDIEMNAEWRAKFVSKEGGGDGA